MRFFENANFNFIGYRFWGYTLSAVLIAISVVTILARGLQYGIDFRGGTELVITCQEVVAVAEIRTILTPALGKEPQVRIYGDLTEMQVRTDVEIPGQSTAEVVTEALSNTSCEVAGSNQIGPVFAKDIRDSALNVTIFSILVIGIYILFRFKEITFMVSVIITLVHDTIIILGIFTLFNGILPFDMDINQSLVAALLTVIGYSLNDTIVVFDRIRENRNIFRGIHFSELLNNSMNQTLSRTVVTSLTTFFVVAVLFFFAGESLKGFSFALMIGVALGTYSTLFFSCPLVLDLPLKKRKLIVEKKKTPVKVA